MLSVEDWAEIRRLSKAEKLSIKEIARQVGVARNTVRSALRSDEPPAYRREQKGPIVDAVEPDIRRLLMTAPRMPDPSFGRRRPLGILETAGARRTSSELCDG